MARIINTGEELVRINFEKQRLEYSKNDGKTWIPRYTGSSCGEFIDLLIFGDEVLAVTSKGLYYSKNEGRTWIPRYTGSSCGDFQTIQENGTELLATTSKGLYYSKNEGRTWLKK